MCGIWGCVSFSDSIYRTHELFSLFQATAHRGPDGSVFRQFSYSPSCSSDEINIPCNISLGFHRLAIHDVTRKGDQPFIVETKYTTVYCLCNGEIYNYEEILERYPSIREKLYSSSDCELLPHLFVMGGIEFLKNNIRGEYAIAIVEVDKLGTKGPTIYLTRDCFGVRPLFFNNDSSQLFFSSEAKSIPRHLYGTKQYPHNVRYIAFRDGKVVEQKPEAELSLELNRLSYKTIRGMFVRTVEEMMTSDRPIGALLSGGLDSSIVVATLSRFMRNGDKLRTFSIGMEGGTDEVYARRVSEFCGTDHTHVTITIDDMIGAIEDVVYITESWDVTTIRATLGQYLLGKWIRENTDIKVLFVGDGSDELAGGYIYNRNAPTSEDVALDGVSLLQNIRYFDGLRADRGISANGLEVRVPFLNELFARYYTGIDYNEKYSTLSIEKYTLRMAFSEKTLEGEEPYLPEDIVWRKKEAFSDGVSSTTQSLHTSLMLNAMKHEREYIHIPSHEFPYPKSEEAKYYLYLYSKHFTDTRLVPRYWMPRWVGGNVTDPSARVLDVY